MAPRPAAAVSALAIMFCIAAGAPFAAAAAAEGTPTGIFSACYEAPDAQVATWLDGNVRVEPIKSSGAYTIDECAAIAAARPPATSALSTRGAITTFVLAGNDTVCASAVGLSRSFRAMAKQVLGVNERNCTGGATVFMLARRKASQEPGGGNRRLLQAPFNSSSCSQVQNGGGCNLLDYEPALPYDIIRPLQMVGGLGGGSAVVSFCDQDPMNYATQITLWWDQNTHGGNYYVDQVTVSWADGTSTTYGSCRGNNGQRINCNSIYSAGDTNRVFTVPLGLDNPVTTLSLAVDGGGKTNWAGAGSYLGTTLFETSNTGVQRGFNAVSKSGTLYAIKNLGSGLVCGITVRAGAVVDAFGLLFWNRIANAEVLDMQQDYTPQPLVSSQNSAMVTCPMPGANVGYTSVTSGLSESTTTSFSETTTATVGFKLGFKYTVAKVVEYNGEFSFSYSKATTTSVSNTVGSTTTIQNTMNNVCPQYLSEPAGQPLVSGDCCQFYSAQRMVKADRVPWTGRFLYTFVPPGSNGAGAVNRTYTVSGTNDYTSYSSTVTQSYYCQPKPANGQCSSLPPYQVTAADVDQGTA